MLAQQLQGLYVCILTNKQTNNKVLMCMTTYQKVYDSCSGSDGQNQWKQLTEITQNLLSGRPAGPFALCSWNT
jgi:hypothetical protein